ncbi:hypothetical protein H0H92_002624 [Tricholoma furcatifolium]|nr:hypothetical protein H0H92_002624 [Tricholoma furcatifolium]
MGTLTSYLIPYTQDMFDILPRHNETFYEFSVDDQVASINNEPRSILTTGRMFFSNEPNLCLPLAESVKYLKTGIGLDTSLVPPPRQTSSPSNDIRGTLHVGQLPTDVLYYLFSFMQSGDPDVWFRTAITLSHVCAHWRYVAIGAPLLWSHVRLSTQCRRDLCITLDNILHRSKSLNLSVHLFIRPSGSFGSYGVQTLSKHGPRIRMLAVSCPPTINYGTSVRKILSPLPLPLLRSFSLQMTDFNQMRLSVTTDREDQITDLQLRRVLRRARHHLRMPYLDWTIQNFHITSLSLKSVTVLYRDLYPILVASQSTLTHLGYLVSNCHRDWENQRSRFLTFPKLMSLHIGYGCIKPAYQLAKRLVLPNLQSLVLHDFRRCPDSELPTLVPETITPGRSDALKLLRVMSAWTTITRMTLRGIECFTSTYEEVMVTLQNLFRGLQSLSLLDCDGKFLHILRDFTSTSPHEDVAGLSELSIVAHDYPMVLDILRLRAGRELPRLKTLSVNPMMAILRPFVRDFVVELNVHEVPGGSNNHMPPLSSRRRRRNSM